MRLPASRFTRKARIEIIPLIDIMFFLLATFVMVSMSMIKNRGIPVQLPKAGSGVKESRDSYTSITVAKDGKFFIDKEEVSPEALPQAIENLKQNLTDPKVFLNADTEADFGLAVRVLDELRNKGIEKISIETRPQEKR